jgi:ubiquinone/menaquinone biosynthesis C-methylase UbiE
MAENQFTQKSEFLSGEGNQWYARNQMALSTPSPIRLRLVQSLVTHLPAQGRPRVLEIGCADGANLVALAALRDIEAHGVEPSSVAVQDGRQRHPGLTLQVGSADTLPYGDDYFDMVVFGFCLYLIDRGLLFRCVAEADRVLRKGGTLVILDFDPPIPTSRPYVHRQGLMSFKMDHSRLFTAHPTYVLAEKHTLNHHGWHWHSDPGERIALWLLRKDPDYAFTHCATG